MVKRQSGFVLLIVLGLLGALAFMALNLVELSQQAKSLGQQHHDVVRSRMLARSGIELAMGQLAIDPFLTHGTYTRSVGDGTRSPFGDTFRVSIQDASGAINLNDGLESAQKERGDHLADNAMQSMEEEPIVIVPFDMHVRHYCFGPGGAISAVKPGDKLKVWDAYPNGSVLDTTEVRAIGGIMVPPSMTYEETLEVGHLLPVTAGSYVAEIVREKPLGFFNLRLRHMLNAYGDAHRFVEKYGWPVWKSEEWEAGVRGEYGNPFIPTSTALGDFDAPTPGVDGVGVPIVPDDPSLVATQSTGLGDRLIAARPPGGYKTLSQVEAVVTAWSNEHMISAAGRELFRDRVTVDFAVLSPLDPSFTRIKREFGKRRKPLGRDVKHTGQLIGADNALLDAWGTDNQFLLESMPRGYFNFSDLFTAHAVAPLNICSASPWVRSAVFWAPTNVGYVAEGIRTSFDVKAPLDDQIARYHTKENSFISNPERFVGVSEPVFIQPELENGVDTPVTRKKFMSLRDALVTSQACGEYLETQGPINTFDGFRHFLEWRRDQAVDYEKVLPRSQDYNGHRVHGGHFTQDYAEETLPIVMGCLRRIPGYLGAPQALLSTYKELEPLEWEPLNPPLSRTYGDIYSASNEWDWLRFHSGTHPTVKVEDFVSRVTLPKVAFRPQGMCRIISRGDVRYSGVQAPAHSEIDATVEVFKTFKARSQKDFLALTDPDTHSMISLGPELQGSSRYPDPDLGVVGLKDTPDDTDALEPPVIDMDFSTPHISRLGPPPIAGHLVDHTLTAWLDVQSQISSGWFQTPSSFVSVLEGFESPFFDNRSRGCDYSPFNGVNLLSFDHGPNPEPAYQRTPTTPPSVSIWNLTDSLYWRPAIDPSTGMHLLNDSKPTGFSAGVGSVSLWFRIPSGDRFPGDESDFHPVTLQPVRTRTRGAFHMLFCLNLWECAEQWWIHNVATNREVPEGRPISLQLGYVFDTSTQQGKIVGRYETRNRWYSYAYPGEFPLFPGYTDPNVGYSAFSGWFCSGAPYGADYDYMGLFNPDWSSMENYFTYDKVQVATTNITLRQIPENGPGTWHRVTFAWDGRYGSTEPLKLVLHDTSNMEGLHSVIFEENYGDATDPEPYDMMPWDSNMTLSFGEAHGRCRLLPGQHPFFSGDGADVNGDFSYAFRTYAPGRYLPVWRLDSA
ncbi:MAG: hypothetical protein AB7F75_11835, partial [Planctomycetota bacterium]